MRTTRNGGGERMEDLSSDKLSVWIAISLDGLAGLQFLH